MKHIFILLIASCSFIKGNGQEQKTEAIFRQDSLLFSQQALDSMVCPMVNFNEAYDTYCFLKRQQQRSLARRKRVPSSWMDVDVNNDSKDSFWGDEVQQFNELEYGNSMQTKIWKSYKEMWRKAYNVRHTTHYDETQEKSSLIKRLTVFSQKATFKPMFFKTIERDYNNSITAYVDALYEKSLMNNRRSLKRFLRVPKRKRLETDLGTEMTLSLIMYNIWLKNHSKIKAENISKFVYTNQ